MSYQFTTRDGQRVELNVATDFDRLNTAFQRAFPGISLKITRGSVTEAEQTEVFLSRYVTAGNVRGRYVYDTRWWNGQMWFRISPAGTVAAPRTSNHEIDGPNGPRSIDIRDTGATAGVTVRGTVRDRWMEANAGNYGFENEGYKFREAWHKTYRRVLSTATSKPPASSGGSSAPFVPPVNTEEIEGEPMFIAVVNGSWKLVIDQGTAKPRAVVLGGDSNAAKSGLPVINFTWQPSIDQLKQAVTNI